jgi:hypothetical protein
MVLKIIKSVIIKAFPVKVVRKLRYGRVILERIYSCMYKLGLGREFSYPYFLKYNVAGCSNYSVPSNDIRHRWGEAFCDYNNSSDDKTVKLVWAEGPIPGNYGDWLSPYIIKRLCAVNVTHLSEVGHHKDKHIVALGSILSLANKNSVVVGAGIPNSSDPIDINSKFYSVRGPYSERRLLELGGKACGQYGDLGFLLRRVYKPREAQEKKGIIVVRHTQHLGFNLNLDEGFREISICRAKPDDIESFIDELFSADLVATSAMHCFITCISYSIPCVLFSIGNWKTKVPGDGIKYKDALAGAGLPEISPLMINDSQSFCREILSANVYTETVSDEILDSIEKNLKTAVFSFDSTMGI